MGFDRKRLDVDSVFANRSLKHIRSQVIAKDYPQLLWDQFVPMEEGVPAGADSFLYQEMDSRGDAAVVTNYADDPPLTDVVLTETASGIVGLATGYQYNIQDLRKAQMSGMQLPARKALAARDRLERKLADLVAEGDTAHNLNGFVNSTAVSAANVPNPGSGTEWSNKTAEQRLEDIFLAVASIQDSTENIEGQVVDILLPPEQFFLLQSTRLGNTTIQGIQYVQSAVPQVRSINSWWRLKGKGAGSTDRMIIYTRDPDKLAAVVPIRLNTMPMEQRGFGWVELLEARCGGTVIYKPKSMVYRDAI